MAMNRNGPMLTHRQISAILSSTLALIFSGVWIGVYSSNDPASLVRVEPDILQITAIASILISVLLAEAFVVYLKKQKKWPLRSGPKPSFHLIPWLLLAFVPLCAALIAGGPFGVAVFGIFIGMQLVLIGHTIFDRSIPVEDNNGDANDFWSIVIKYGWSGRFAFLGAIACFIMGLTVSGKLGLSVQPSTKGFISFMVGLIVVWGCKRLSPQLVKQWSLVGIPAGLIIGLALGSTPDRAGGIVLLGGAGGVVFWQGVNWVRQHW